MIDDAKVSYRIEPGPPGGQLVDLAAGVARYLLAGERMTHRRCHTATVARRAKALAPAVEPEEAATLVAAAWLHDIGYVEELRQKGYHPLDGARQLRSTGWPPLLCQLVAHHSGARFVALVCGLGPDLGEFAFVEDRLSDALTVADQTAGPDGRPMTIDERIADMLARHGPESPNALANNHREPYIRAAAGRVVARLHEAGADTTGIFSHRHG